MHPIPTAVHVQSRLIRNINLQRLYREDLYLYALERCVISCFVIAGAIFSNSNDPTIQGNTTFANNRGYEGGEPHEMPPDCVVSGNGLWPNLGRASDFDYHHCLLSTVSESF